MEKEDIVITFISVGIGVVIAIEVVCYFQIFRVVDSLKCWVGKAVALLRASNISDHWKEKVLPRYALAIMAESFKLLSGMGLVFASFCIVYGIGIYLFHQFAEGFERLLHLEMQILIGTMSLVYGVVRNRLSHG